MLLEWLDQLPPDQDLATVSAHGAFAAEAVG